jgi:hypothetical protein
MRYLFGFICVLALGVMGCGETTGAGGDGGSAGTGGGGSGGSAGTGGGGVGGEAGSFIAGAPVVVSGLSPFAECDADFDPDVVFSPDSEVETWIAVNPTNPDHMAAAWQQDRYSNGGCRGNVAGISFDGGASWEMVVIPGLAPCSGGTWDRATDPWLAFAANGDLYSASLVFDIVNNTRTTERGIVVNKSVDGGLTWSEPTTLDRTEPPIDNDKESITADPFDACSIYVTWTRFKDGGAGADIMFSRTTDCGGTWEDPKLLFTSAPAAIAGQLLVLPDGTLVNLFTEFERTPANAPLYAMRSTDKGETWPAEPDVIGMHRPGLVVTPDNNPTFVRQAAMDVAVDRKTGALYMVWEQLFGQLTQIAFSSSSDGGFTWSTPIQVDRTPPNPSSRLEQAFLPSVEVSNDGTIGITYYNFQNETLGNGQADTDHWFIHCDPGATDCNDAESWSPPLRLTQDTFDILKAPLTGDLLFLGDYVGLTSSGSDFFAFFPVTTEDDPANAIFVPIRAR